METAREVLTALARRHAFGDVAALAAGGPDGIQALCSFGQCVLDLDAEDFGSVDGPGVPRALLARARASRMPQTPREQPRGALKTLRPAYALLLEVIQVRWERREMAALVAALHIASEYLPLLAWEPVLGHAGDPALLAAAVAGPHSRFGVTEEAAAGERRCEHTRPERSAARRALRVAGEPAPGWRAYLDRQHSQVAQALAVCAAECRTPCSVITRLTDAERTALGERCRLAQEFADSALVRLRHAAPVGHGFGVPSPEELLEAWDRTRTSLERFELGLTALAGADRDGYPLPGLPGLFSAIATATLTPDTLLYEVTTEITATLTA
ncbi:MAG: hypothetical protein ACRDOO_21495 [Actinomadura sp.]